MPYCIEIYVNDDGSLEVGMEDKSSMMEGQEEESYEGQETREPVADIKAALTKALELYKQAQEGAGSAREQFADGFGAGPEMGAPPVERGMID